MYEQTIEGFSKVAEKKLAALKRSPAGFFVASMLAGAYVGLGIILIFTLGSQVPPEWQQLVLGAIFGRGRRGRRRGHVDHDVDRQSSGLHRAGRALLGGRRRRIALSARYARDEGRGRQDERPGDEPRRARGALQLARVPRDLDV